MIWRVLQLNGETLGFAADTLLVLDGRLRLGLGGLLLREDGEVAPVVHGHEVEEAEARHPVEDDVRDHESDVPVAVGEAHAEGREEFVARGVLAER